MAGRTGLEPVTSCVTGRRYNQLNYRPRPRIRQRTLWQGAVSILELGGAPPCHSVVGATYSLEHFYIILFKFLMRNGL